jgi:hypothetical protein
VPGSLVTRARRLVRELGPAGAARAVGGVAAVKGRAAVEPVRRRVDLGRLHPRFRTKYADTWKDPDVAEQMLALVRTQLADPLASSPFRVFHDALQDVLRDEDLPQPAGLLELGAGVGHYGVLVRELFGDRFAYTGADYAEELVRAGRRAWPEIDLVVDDLFATGLDWGAYDVVAANCVVDVLAEYERALELVLACRAPVVILHRQRMTRGRSYARSDPGYEGQVTYRSYLNRGHLERLVAAHGRRISHEHVLPEGVHHTFVLPLADRTASAT